MSMTLQEIANVIKTNKITNHDKIRNLIWDNIENVVDISFGVNSVHFSINAAGEYLRYEIQLPKQVNSTKEEKVQEKVKSDGWSTTYYELPSDAKELQDLIEYKNMNFAVANIFKAAYRLNNKDGTSELYDLNKIIWYAQREINRIKKEKGT